MDRLQAINHILRPIGIVIREVKGGFVIDFIRENGIVDKTVGFFGEIDECFDWLEKKFSS